MELFANSNCHFQNAAIKRFPYAGTQRGEVPKPSNWPADIQWPLTSNNLKGGTITALQKWLPSLLEPAAPASPAAATAVPTSVSSVPLPPPDLPAPAASSTADASGISDDISMSVSASEKNGPDSKDAKQSQEGQSGASVRRSTRVTAGRGALSLFRNVKNDCWIIALLSLLLFDPEFVAWAQRAM